MSPIVFSGEDEGAAGFVLNKLYTLKCFAKRGNIRHGRHTELTNMPKGYLPECRGLVISVCRRMNNKLVLIFKSTGEDHICALNEEDALKVGLEICNRYRKKVELPPLDRCFKEILTSGHDEAKSHKAMTEKEKRNREYLERTKKWMADQGLS